MPPHFLSERRVDLSGFAPAHAPLDLVTRHSEGATAQCAPNGHHFELGRPAVGRTASPLSRERGLNALSASAIWTGDIRCMLTHHSCVLYPWERVRTCDIEHPDHPQRTPEPVRQPLPCTAGSSHR